MSAADFQLQTLQERRAVYDRFGEEATSIFCKAWTFYARALPRVYKIHSHPLMVGNSSLVFCALRSEQKKRVDLHQNILGIAVNLELPEEVEGKTFSTSCALRVEAPSERWSKGAVYKVW